MVNYCTTNQLFVIIIHHNYGKSPAIQWVNHYQFQMGFPFPTQFPAIQDQLFGKARGYKEHFNPEVKGRKLG
jgi:hypothetical protein